MRMVPTASFIKEIIENHQEVFPEWVSVAVDDLAGARSINLRRFLQNFGMEAPKGRSGFKAMVEIYVAYRDLRQDPDSVKRLLAATARLFPSSHEGQSLKATLFGSRAVGQSGQQSWLSLGLPEADLLEELVTTPHYAAFDPAVLKVTDRASNLANLDLSRASQIAHLFLEGHLTKIGESFMEGLSEALLSHQNFDHSRIQLAVLAFLIRQRPQIANSPVIWQRSADDQRLLFSLIKENITLTPEELHSVVFAMLDAGSDVVAPDLASAFKSAVAIVLDWCNTRGLEAALQIGIEWKRVLTSHAASCMEWIGTKDSKEPLVLVLLATLLDPHAETILNSDHAMWIDAAKHAKEFLPDDLLTKGMVFFLALGFHNRNTHGAKLVVESFEIVHLAAQESRLEEGPWQLLASQCPSVSWNGYWDKCERLRGGLIDHFMRFRWPYQDLLNCLKNPEVVKKVVAQALEHGGWFYSQRHYIRDLGEQVLSGELSATPEQTDVFASSKNPLPQWLD
jgi:hypothetical protein